MSQSFRSVGSLQRYDLNKTLHLPWNMKKLGSNALPLYATIIFDSIAVLISLPIVIRVTPALLRYFITNGNTSVTPLLTVTVTLLYY